MSAIPTPDPAADQAAAIAKMKRLWEAFIQKQAVPQKELRPDILKSWQRCLSLDVNPDNHDPAFLSSDLIQKRVRIHKECIDAIDPVVESVNDLIDVSNHVIAFVDPEGYVLKIFGCQDVRDMLASVNFRVGANWNERFAGTTAVGIALKTGQPSHVFHAEHYCRRLHQFTCTAVPIRDPYSLDVIGILDFVAYVRDHQPHSQGMALQMGRCVELEIYRNRKERHDFFREYSTQLTLDQMERGVVVLDEHDRIQRANIKALEYLGLESQHKLGVELKSLKIFEDWQNLDHPFFISSDGENEIRLARQSIIHQKRIIGSLILLEKGDGSHQKSSERKSVSKPIGQSPRFLKLLERAENMASFDSNILIMGETGTGKDIIAKYIHQMGRRRNESFIAINCGSIPRELLGSELFGYEAGAFTGARKNGHPSKFELSDGGTLLLDEISEMPLESQVYLLRVIEERAVTRLGGNRSRPVDIRIIASSNKDLQQEVDAGHFRADLLFRLNVLRIDMPKLHQRREDISLLSYHFLETLSERLGKKIAKISEDALSALIAYEWPGNIRELRNTIEQAIVMAQSPILQLEYLPDHIQKAYQIPTEVPSKDRNRYIRFMEAYRNANGNISRTAKELGISRPTVYAWLKKFGLTQETLRK